MTDSYDDDGIIARDAAPEHGPNFWNDLEAAIDNEPQGSLGQTSQLPVAAPMRQAPASPTPPTPLRPGQPAARRAWPLAAAAAAVLLLGLGFIALRATSDPATTTEVVAASPTATEAPTFTSGSADADAEPSDVDAQTTEPESVDGDDSAELLADGGDEEIDDASAADETPASVPAATTAPAPTAAPIPDFAAAPGAVGDPDFVPLDQGIPDDGTYLANWPERGVTWYAVEEANTGCTDATHAEIRYVNASGITQDVRDPQLRFSGEIAHFAVSSDRNQAAWITGCGTQLELFVANLHPTGEVADLRLVWLGEGTISSALVAWTGSEAALNAIEPGGTAFAVSYDVETELVARNGGPSRIMIEAGAPAARSLTPLAATPNGGLTYWAGSAPASHATACADLVGTDRGETLWLRQGEGQWQSAVGVDVPMATVTAAALDVASQQLAFADQCAGEVGRVVIGSVQPDGRLADLRELDLTPYVPGFADQLHWVDADTLRIETDNTEFGVDPVRFDFRIDDGVIVQLD